MPTCSAVYVAVHRLASLLFGWNMSGSYRLYLQYIDGKIDWALILPALHNYICVFLAAHWRV